MMLKAKCCAFETDVEDLRDKMESYKDEIRNAYDRERERSKNALVMACWRAIRHEPPKTLVARIAGTKPTMQEAKSYLAQVIDGVLPTLDDICRGMKVNFVIKDVTWETLNDRDFVEWLRNSYKRVKELKAPFETYTAAKGRTQPPFGTA